MWQRYFKAISVLKLSCDLKFDMEEKVKSYFKLYEYVKKSKELLQII